MSPTVSVIPLLNGSKALCARPEAIQPRRQPVTEVIVDDARTDGTRAMAAVGSGGSGHVGG